MTEIYLHIVARMADYMATHLQRRLRLGQITPHLHNIIYVHTSAVQMIYLYSLVELPNLPRSGALIVSATGVVRPSAHAAAAQAQRAPLGTRAGHRSLRTMHD